MGTVESAQVRVASSWTKHILDASLLCLTPASSRPNFLLLSLLWWSVPCRHWQLCIGMIEQHLALGLMRCISHSFPGTSQTPQYKIPYEICSTHIYAIRKFRVVNTYVTILDQWEKGSNVILLPFIFQVVNCEMHFIRLLGKSWEDPEPVALVVTNTILHPY